MKEKVKITLLNTAFTVVHTPALNRVLEDMLKEMTTYKPVFDRKTRRMVSQKDKVFAAKHINPNILRFNINVIGKFISLLKIHGYTKDDVILLKDKEYKIDKLDLKVNPEFTSREYQNKYKAGIVDIQEDNRAKLVNLQTGMGKALADDMLVKTVLGWKKISNLNVGDAVISRDGSITEVLGVYPQDGIRDVFEFKLDDNRSLDADDNHLWKVYSKLSTKPKGEVITTKEVRSRLTNNEQLFIDLPQPHLGKENEIEDIDHALDFDRFLTDENLYNMLLESRSVQREYILDKIISSYTYTIVKNSFILEIGNNLEKSKFIIDLVRSVGGVVYKDIDVLGIKLSIKLQKYNFVTNKEIRKLNPIKPFIRIKSVKVCRQTTTTCIAVDNEDKLFLAQDYIVTHNTFIAMNSLVELNMKFGILVLPKYIEKWIMDVKKLTNIKDEEICVVQGSNQLINLMLDVIEGDRSYKVVIFSMRTVYNYIKAYEQLDVGDEFMYPVEPQNLMQLLRLGVLLNDESHQEFYSLFKTTLYFNTKLLLGLSATFDTNDKYIKTMHDLLFPDKDRLANIIEYNRYIDIYSIRYFFEAPLRIQHQRSQGYNHILLEQSVMRNRNIKNNYFDLILKYIKEGYYDRYEKGDKVLIFCASIDMCTELTMLTKRIYPRLKVNRYVEDDPFENVLNSDICFSTVLSSGTAIDIPNLTTVVQTISIASPTANKQALGRLREIKGRDMRYYYIFAGNLDKQVNLHKVRMEMLKPLSKTYTHLQYDKRI